MHLYVQREVHELRSHACRQASWNECSEGVHVSANLRNRGRLGLGHNPLQLKVLREGVPDVPAFQSPDDRTSSVFVLASSDRCSGARPLMATSRRVIEKRNKGKHYQYSEGLRPEYVTLELSTAEKRRYMYTSR